MNMARCVGSPQMPNENMAPPERDRAKINDPSILYREIIVKLQYLVTCTRPDIANAVRSLGRHAGPYSHANFVRAKRVLQIYDVQGRLDWYTADQRQNQWRSYSCGLTVIQITRAARTQED